MLRGLAHYKKIFLNPNQGAQKKIFSKKTLLFSSCYKNNFLWSMTWERWLGNFKFGEVDIEKESHYSFKKAIDAYMADIQKELVPDEFAYGKNKEMDVKYFIACKTGKKIEHY